MHSQRFASTMAKTVSSIDAVLSESNKKRCQEVLARHVYRQSRPSRQAAVLVPLCTTTKSDEPSILFTVRAKHIRRNPGDVCFPGGRMDALETAEAAALRETQEEIGLERDRIDVWGTLPMVYTYDRHFSVMPIIANCGKLDVAELHANRQQDEVDFLFTKSIAELCDEKHHDAFRLLMYRFPCFVFDDAPKIWGLTAFILHYSLNLLVPDAYKNPTVSLPNWFLSKL